MGKCPLGIIIQIFGKYLGKFPWLGSCHLGKYLMEVATLENVLWETLFKYTSWYLYRERIAGFTQGQDDILRAKEALDLERETLNMDKKTLSNLRSEHSRLKDDFRQEINGFKENDYGGKVTILGE